LVRALVLVVLVFTLALAAAPAVESSRDAVKVLTFSYRSHDGASRVAYVVLPAWYGPARHPALPLVISPHGRGVSGSYNLRFWGALPARGPFVLVSPDGQGRKLPFYSWGYRGQIDDLARMPELARRALPWLRLDGRRIYGIGDSMGGQEVLLLAARRGLRLAGVIALDPVTDMAARYRKWFVTPGEQTLPARARVEIGGTPARRPAAYAVRSPKTYAGAIARSGVPLQLWWSHRDSVVTDQAVETGAFYDRLVALAPSAPVQEVVGYWEHAHEMHPETQLPAALACSGLVPRDGIRVPAYERLANGTIEELPPERGAPDVPLSAEFCGRAG
jgi:pimeloyl-ACP methyl ester carboxylesterase